MKDKQFNEIITHQIKLCEDMLVKKNEEYSSDKDRLHQFKMAAELGNTTPANALAGMMIKHTISVYDMCYGTEKESYSKAKWEEKITDHINYLLLLKAVVFEDMIELRADDKVVIGYSKAKDSELFCDFDEGSR